MNRLFTVALAFALALGSFTYAYAGNTTRIQYHGLFSLGNVLRDISGAAGIQFNLPEDMSGVTFYAHVDADNWKSAAKQALAEFSTVAIWRDDLSSSKVWILRKGKSAPNIAARPAAPKTVQPAVYTVSQQASGAAGAVSDNPLAMLPPHIQHDPEVLRYLHTKGVKLPEDVKEKYGDRLENLPPRRPMFPHVRKNPMFVRYLKSMGLRPPRA